MAIGQKAAFFTGATHMLNMIEGGPWWSHGGVRSLALALEAAAREPVDVDRIISVSSQNWAIDRMPVVDRSILRLAAFELKYVDDVPVSVSINEAVELAKEFGGEDDSHRFVNGILGRIARDSESGIDPTQVAEEEPVAGQVEGAGTSTDAPVQPEPAKADEVAE